MTEHDVRYGRKPIWPVVLLIFLLFALVKGVFFPEDGVSTYERQGNAREAIERETIRQCKAQGMEWRHVQIPNPVNGVMNEYAYRCVLPGATQARP